MTSLSEVTIAEGTVRGRRDGKVRRWKSIPYAEPPVGELRFRAPQPPQPWTGVRAATDFAFAAVQHRSGSQTGARSFQPQSEDCLTINVTAPAGVTAPLPVLVFIHGGGYIFGTSAIGLYAGTGLAAHHDVVVVSFNYRLGVFGYVDFTEFATADRPIESNLGLRDQVAALEWVQRNIAAFGGDPGNVTIFGESAGAAAVTTLLATPAARGLFHRAIAQSAPADWALDRDTAADFARRCVERLDGDLATSDAYQLSKVASRIATDNMRANPGVMSMMPVIDGDFLPRHPLDAMAGGTAHRVPLITGTNRHEGTLFAKFMDELPTNHARIEQMFANADVLPLEQVSTLYTDYPGDRGAVRLGGDYMFWRPTLLATEAHSAFAPTYNYRYDYAPPLLKRMGLGATHASELIAVFGFGETKAGRALTAIGGRGDLRTVTEHVQGHWLSFARTGEPLASWPRYDSHSRRTLVFDVKPRVVSDLDRTRRIAWAGYPRVYGGGAVASAS